MICLLFVKLEDVVQLMKGPLSRTQQAVLSSFIVTEVYSKDVVAKLLEQKVYSVNDFEWVTKLK